MGEHTGFHRAWSYVLDEPARILFVDDDVILTEFAKVHLSTPVATVESAHDGNAALSMLSTGSFDVALIDIEMPGLDGLSLVQRIRRDPRLEHLPIIMVTGREDVISIDRSFEVGATSFVTKPVNWRQLSHQIRYVLRNARAEREVRAARDRAEQVSALKSNLLAAMRHEFRTPLNTIIGFAALLRERLADAGQEGDLAEFAGHIQEAGGRLLGTCNDMLQFARLMSKDRVLDPGVYPIEGIVAAAMQPRAGPGSAPRPKITVAVAEPQLDLACDRELLVGALRHLIANAETHGQGADIRVECVRRDDGSIVFAVSDQGPGIPTDRLHACLEPFEQSDMSRAKDVEGLGLGLPIAKEVADLHGGLLTVDSPPGEGTRISIVLPASRVSSPDVDLCGHSQSAAA